MVRGTLAALAVLAVPLPAAAHDHIDERPCFSRSEVETVHDAWRRARVERHTETAGLGVETVTPRGWTRVTYPGCTATQSVVVVYDERGRWMSIGRS